MNMRRLALFLALLTFLALGASVVALGGTPQDDGVIVYSRYFPEGGDSALCMTDPDGARTAVLRVFNDENAGFPAWSPDGSSITFTLDDQIVVISADGKDPAVVADGRHPSWSPDGTLLTYEFEGQVWIAGVDGSDPHPIGPGRNPDWSPDGERIAFDQIPQPEVTDGPEGELKTTDTDGGDLQDLGYGLEAAWSPAGIEIAFTDRTYWESSLAVVDTQDGSRRGLSKDEFGPHRPSLPAWSPDGTRVIFSFGDALWSVASDGTDPQKILEHGGSADWAILTTPPSWEGRSCTKPRRSVSLALYGHLFARGKVRTNDPVLCETEGIDVSVWKKTSKGLRLAGTAETDSDSRYDVELKPRRRGDDKPDRPGRYLAEMNGADSMDCARSGSGSRTHEH
jgi:Tol biopolymer transport system component